MEKEKTDQQDTFIFVGYAVVLIVGLLIVYFMLRSTTGTNKLSVPAFFKEGARGFLGKSR